jgi:hypothetical protein
MWTAQSTTKGISQNETNTFGMRLLKYLCAFFCLQSLAWTAAFIHPSLLSATHAVMQDTGKSAFIKELVIALLYAAAFYGIHDRQPITWNLGWAALVAMYLGFLKTALSSLQSAEPHPALPEAAIAIGASVIALYGCRWWNRHKPYFYPRNQKTDSPPIHTSQTV